MIVEKNGKQYEVTEWKNHWSVMWKNGAVTARFQIPKNLCKTEEEIKAYIQIETMF